MKRLLAVVGIAFLLSSPVFADKTPDPPPPPNPTPQEPQTPKCSVSQPGTNTGVISLLGPLGLLYVLARRRDLAAK